MGSEMEPFKIDGIASMTGRSDAEMLADQARARETCPEGCGCRLGTPDADRFECGCDGPCTTGA